MNAILQKLVDSGFMNESHAQYIEKAIDNKDTLIASGHKGWGILPLMATIGAVAKSKYSIQQVKGFDDLKAAADYYVIPDLKDIDFAKLVTDTVCIPNSSLITIKDPDHPYSMMKILKDMQKATGDNSKVFQVIECAKINDEKKLSKITKMTFDDAGKIIRTDFE